MTTAVVGGRMFCHPDLPSGVSVVELSFAPATVFIMVDEQSDALISIRTVQEDLVRPDRLLSSEFWDPVVGKILVGVWFMTNDRGYLDAMQLRFREQPNAGAYSTIQLNGEASQISLAEFISRRCQSMFRNSEAEEA
jgi:hypothetical protein